MDIEVSPATFINGIDTLLSESRAFREANADLLAEVRRMRSERKTQAK